MPVIIAVTVAEDFSACQAATIYILKGLKELFRENEYRTQYCNAVTENDIGKKVRAAGWVENIRDHGGIMFVDLRDHYGVVQVVFHNEKLLEGIHKECAVSIAGTVLKRDESTYNDKIETGTVEIEAEEVRILGKVTEQLPFEVATSRETREDVRLKYRYLDLRNKKMHDNIVLRSKIISFLRNKMSSMGFLELQTPILSTSSPEGARDYLIPSRKHHGKFYALPQAPQIFKQIYMVSGFDKYFQIAPCFRDEDARGDRSPGEFYQLDMEMAFAGQEDVFTVIEQVLPPIFAKYGAYNIASQAPFTRIPYLQAMEEFGTDKPDLRIDLRVKDVTGLLQSCGFGPFENSLIKAVPVSNCKLTRKNIDKLCADVEVQAGQKPYWFRVDENGEVVGGIAKFLNADPALAQQVKGQLALENDTLVLLCAGTKAQVWKTSGVMVKMAGAQCEGHMDRERYEFCWIVDFPMYEIGEESGQLEFCHNPFSMPSGGLEVLLQAERGEVDPLTIQAEQYDLVCNGVELSSGAVRNHDPEIMVKAFELVGLPDAAVKESRDRVRSALKNCGFDFPVSRITMNLAPADKRKEGPIYDLPLLLALLLASRQLTAATEGCLFLGELSLSGELRPIRGVLAMAAQAGLAGLAAKWWLGDVRAAGALRLSARGLMPKPSTSRSKSESWRTLPPAASISQTCIEPLRSERK